MQIKQTTRSHPYYPKWFIVAEGVSYLHNTLKVQVGATPVETGYYDSEKEAQETVNKYNKKQNPKYYKIVRIQNEEKISTNNYISRKLQSQYLEGQFVGPVTKGTKLHVFDSLENVRLFNLSLGTFEIWECEVVNPQPCKGLFYDLLVIDCCILGKINRPKSDAPTGTLEVDMVKLTRKVEDVSN